MVKNIKQLFPQIENKYEFILLLSNEFKIKPSSIRTNWFSTFYSVPDKHQKRVVQLLQNTIKNQNLISA
jgi:hypothetical protein|tara:strand:- start:467 stop:673 length:207 start_codon:yes stop_codon:yes gene_type:complete